MNPSDNPDPPSQNSYWVIPGRFAAGEYPGAKDRGEAAVKLRTLLAAGINHFVDLTEPHELVPYTEIAADEARRLSRQVEHERRPVVDLSVPGSPAKMADILDTIDGALDAGRTVYLHCWGGVGRTGTVVGCWLVRHGRTGDEALQQLADWWQGVEKVHRTPQSPETPEQFRYVREWQERPEEENSTGEISMRDRFRGCLLGLAAGDALGTTLEFKAPGTFEPIDDMVGGGPFNLRPGQWTDDTSMALCLATSLLESGGFDATDQMQRYVRWWQEGYLSSTGRCFDIGTTVRGALSRFERDGDPYAGSTDPNAAGNGSLMRLAPVAMYFAGDAEEAVAMAADSSRTTHGAQEAVDACGYFGGLLVGALKGEDKEALLSSNYWPPTWDLEPEPLAKSITRIADGSFKDHSPPDIKGTGYVVDAIEAALWAFQNSDNFREGALLAVNLGNDADTTGAIYGQIAGAYYGAESIPAAWREKITMVTQITSLADQLHDHAQKHIPTERDVERVPVEASVTEETGEIAGVQVRWLSVTVSGHTVEQLLIYDTDEAARVHGRPFDDELDREMQLSMFAVDRIWMDETMHKVASAAGLVVDGKCLRWARIEHCNDIRPGSASWVRTRADGTPVETEPWSCVSGTPPISHVGLTTPDDVLDSAEVPLAVAAVREFEVDLDDYIRDYKAAILGRLAEQEGTEHASGSGRDQGPDERAVTATRYVTKPNGQRVQIDDQGWGLTKDGRRDRRHKKPIGPQL